MSLSDVVCDYGNDFSVHGPCNQFIVPKYFIDGPEGSRQNFLNRVRFWVNFLRQDEVRPYRCDIEGVGILSRAEFEPGLPFQSVTGFMKTLPRSLLDILTPVAGKRMSRTSDKYVGGPISLVNHACKKHANCHFDHNGCVLVSEDYIGAGQKLRYVYNDNKDELFLTTGFKCFTCSRYLYIDT